MATVSVNFVYGTNNIHNKGAKSFFEGLKFSLLEDHSMRRANLKNPTLDLTAYLAYYRELPHTSQQAITDPCVEKKIEIIKQ